MKKELKALLLPPNNRAYMGNMGRRDYGTQNGRVRDVTVPLNNQGYDAGGAYWGIGKELRCSFCIVDGVVVYRKFYRKGE